MRNILSAHLHDIYIRKKEKGIEGQISYLEIGNVNIGDKSYFFSEKKSVRGCKIARKNDLLVSRVRPTRGAIIQVNEEYLYVSSAFCVIENILMADRYLYYYLIHNSDFYRYLGENCTGTMYPTISEDIILDYKISIFPLNEQKRIAAKLDKIIPKIDRVKELLERIPQIIKRFRQSVLTAAVTGKLTEKWRAEYPVVERAGELLERIKKERERKYQEECEKAKNAGRRKPPKPHSFLIGAPIDIDIGDAWISTWLGNLIYDFRYGTSKKSDKNNKGMPVVRIPNILAKYIDFKDLKYLNNNNVNENNKISMGDILIVRSNGSKDLVGKNSIVQQLDTEIAFASYLIRIRPSIVESEYIYILLNTPFIKGQFFSNAKSSSGINNINTEELSKTVVYLPPLKEQREIVRQVDKLFSFADKLEGHYKKEKEKIDKLPQSVLAKAFRGELVPQEPNDEPASVLHARIKEEREKQQAAKPYKKRNSSKRCQAH